MPQLNAGAPAEAPAAEFRCFVAMRYWHPFSEAAARAVRDWGATEVVLLPLYWMFRSSIAENDQMYGTTIEFFPKKLTLAQFDQAINKWKFGLFLSNSVAVGLVTTALTTVMATLAAYSLVRLRYPGRAALARAVQQRLQRIEAEIVDGHRNNVRAGVGIELRGDGGGIDVRSVFERRVGMPQHTAGAVENQ